MTEDMLRLLVIIVLFVIPFIFKMIRNYSQNQILDEYLGAIEKHGAIELAEIIEWEHDLRLAIVEQGILLKKGEITQSEYISAFERMQDFHEFIERKYNVTKEEMEEYYLNSDKYRDVIKETLG